VAAAQRDDAFGAVLGLVGDLGVAAVLFELVEGDRVARLLEAVLVGVVHVRQALGAEAVEGVRRPRLRRLHVRDGARLREVVREARLRSRRRALARDRPPAALAGRLALLLLFALAATARCEEQQRGERCDRNLLHGGG